MSNEDGYRSKAYAECLSRFGTLIEVPASGGWIIVRNIQGSSLQDGIGPYPVFACSDWTRLSSDFDGLSDRLVAIGIVPDPLCEPREFDLKAAFDHVVPFKLHYVVDLTGDWRKPVNREHLRQSRKAREQVSIEAVDRPIELLDEWCLLYENLIARHHIRGMAAFSRESFAGQLALPNIMATRAKLGERTVGINLFILAPARQVATYHLAALSAEGYASKASFALLEFAFDLLASRGYRKINLGAGAGLNPAASDGLTMFKRGWTPHYSQVFFCGRILQAEAYERLTAAASKGATTSFFPAYRAPEFVGKPG